MKKKLIPFVLAALMIPGVAFAKGPKPDNALHGNHGKARVMYVLRGMIYAYTAYDSSTSTPGSITIDVNHSNCHGRLLAGQTITISTGPKTRILLKHGVTTIAASQPGDRGTVKVRAARLAFKSATLADAQNALLDQPSFKVIDRGPTSSG